MATSYNLGTPVSAPITTYTANDKYATAFADEINGGLHTATSLADRNSIPVDRRKVGMHCQIIDSAGNRSEYILINNPTTDMTTNTDWAKCIVYAKEVLMSDGTDVETAINKLAAKTNIKKMFYCVGFSDIAVGPCPLELPCGYAMTLNSVSINIPKGTILVKDIVANIEVYQSGTWVLVNSLTLPAGGGDNMTINLSSVLTVAATDRVRLNFLKADNTAQSIVGVFSFTEV